MLPGDADTLSRGPPATTWSRRLSIAALVVALHAPLALLFIRHPHPRARITPAAATISVGLLPDPDASRSAAVPAVAARLTLAAPPAVVVAPPMIVVAAPHPPRPVTTVRHDPASEPADDHRPSAAGRAAMPATSHAITPDPDLLAAFEREISAAVQRAVLYPAAARRLRREGRAQLRFTVMNGRAAEISLAVSSGSPMLNDEAVAAVRRAAMPAVPAGLATQRLTLTIWVSFRLVDNG